MGDTYEVNILYGWISLSYIRKVICASDKSSNIVTQTATLFGTERVRYAWLIRTMKKTFATNLYVVYLAFTTKELVESTTTIWAADAIAKTGTEYFPNRSALTLSQAGRCVNSMSLRKDSRHFTARYIALWSNTSSFLRKLRSCQYRRLRIGWSTS
jgi:hypothetical protein